MTRSMAADLAASDHAAIPRRGQQGRGRPGERPPGPRGIPWLGAGPWMAADPIRRLHEWPRRYGDVFGYHAGQIELYFLAHPDDIASVLVGEHQMYMKDDLSHMLGRFLGRGLVVSEGSYWKRQRRLAAPSFQPRHIERFAATMVERSTHWASRMGGEGVRDIHTDMMGLTLDVVLHTLFGEASVPDFGRIDEIVATLMREFQRRYLSWRRLLPSAMMGESEGRMDWARAALDDVLFAIIRERRATGAEGDDLLGRLLVAQDDEGIRMTDEQLRDEVATIFLAGHETTALALSYALWLLARSPDVQARWHEEIDTVIGAREPTLADMPALRYTDAVVREAMRLYPPVWAVGREALQDVEIAGWVVPRGAQVVLPQWTVHRDERWFEQPERFEPGRWLDGSTDGLPRFAYFPFGGGPRVCVGNHFSMVESVLALATIARRYALAEDPQFELELMPSVTLRPRNGVRVRLTPRAGARVDA